MGNIHIENMFARKSAIRRRGETLVRYTAESGLDDWIGTITGTIAGTSSAPYYTTQIPNVNQAKSISLGNGVTSIGYRAFLGCSDLTELTIPASVTSIGLTAFQNCSGLTSVTIGSGLTSIESFAFRGCRSLTSMTIPDNVTSIGGDVFKLTNNMQTITFENRTKTQVQEMQNYSWGATIYGDATPHYPTITFVCSDGNIVLDKFVEGSGEIN